MRLLRLLPLLLTIALIWFLDTSHGILPPLGRFLDPVNGAMVAAEPSDKAFGGQFRIPGLQHEVTIALEDRLVPHIAAQNDHDLYLAQGYVHACFRLWQMDLQTRAAAGRVSEVAGKKAFKFDQGQRRKGMVYAAERSLKAMEADPRTKAMLDAYTAGINAYISSLSYAELPLEYKLMNFRPEPWTNLRCALLLKYMADDLTGASDDIAYTALRDQLGQEQYDFLFPEKIAGSDPVIPGGTPFAPPSLQAPPYPGDQVWTHFRSQSKTVRKHTMPGDAASGIGSNNWVVSGSHTASGKPILCNDPHLGLNLPSLWFEVQLTAPGINAYGVSLPGAPGIVIGFNEAISWGFTNNYRDVKDYYAISNAGRDSYLFNGRQTAFIKRPEIIVLKDSATVTDTVLYTVHGPVQYEPERFPDPLKTGNMLAMCWMAHRPTNELLALYLVNRATDYAAFTAAIRHFECPAQNFAYADKAGNIAMWGQGQFINKWKGQGKFVMEGQDSLTLWGQDIPTSENPHVLNPPQGYVASANQSVTDSTYPYWYNGSFTEFRSWEINQYLAAVCGSSHSPQRVPPAPELLTLPDPSTMGRLQNDVKSLLLVNLQPVWSKYLTAENKAAIGKLLGGKEADGIEIPGTLAADRTSGTLQQILWFQLYKDIWQDDFPDAGAYPSAERTMQLLLHDSTSVYYDDKRTQPVETLGAIVQRAFGETIDSLERIRKAVGDKSPQVLKAVAIHNALQWYKVKNTSLTHLAKIPAFSYTQLPTGGWGNTINAMKGNHGPSWRMIVEMDADIKAYGVYPGGQSGNPGSIHYGDNIDRWVEGKYYDLHFVRPGGPKTAFKYLMRLTPA